MAWKYIKSNKIRAYGETDYNRKTIKINPKRHKSKRVRRYVPNKDGSENQLVSILHEENHRKHPKMSEKGVEKLARAMKSKMSKRQKSRMYAKFS